MTFKKGDPKPEGSGMKKGQKTVRSFTAQLIFEKHDFDPLDAVVERLKKDGKGMDEKLFIESCLKVAKFKYAELKSIDHTVDLKNVSTRELIEEAKNLAKQMEEQFEDPLNA